jgi:diaminopimelate epimerase
MQLSFTKMEGTGNDFILIDTTPGPLPGGTDLNALARRLCRRHFGIGADGVILVRHSRTHDMGFRIFNADGSEPEMCGNGMRCFARYVFEKGLVPGNRFRVETLAGTIVPEVLTDRDGFVSAVRVDVGEPVLSDRSLPPEGAGTAPAGTTLTVGGKPLRVIAVSMGNPHAVLFVEDVDTVPLSEIGPAVENHPAFPAKTNVEFIQVLGESELKMRVWERGVGETLACGTGACASLVAAHLDGRCGPRALIHLAGGDLTVEWDRRANRVFKTGPANRVFEGTVEI